MLQVIALAVGLGLLAQPAAFAQQPPPPAAAAAPALPYRLALTAGAAVGMGGWGPQLAGVSDIGGRVQLLPWLGVGLSYLQLSASSNENYPVFTLDAFELSAAWRPVVNRWFDPFAPAGVVGVIRSGGGYMGSTSWPHYAFPSPWACTYVRASRASPGRWRGCISS